jgi:superfamily I DNA and RNA helicase
MAQILFADEIEAPASFRGVLEKHTRSECKRGKPLTPDQLDYVCKAIGDSAVVNDSRTPRADVSESKLGFDIDEIALSEKNLSLEQQEISRADFEGHPQLIRGVAGSGKSIVLANNVANSLVRRMDLPQELQLFSAKDKPAFPRIGVVCFNRSLVSFLKEKIRIAFEERRFETLPEKAITCNYMNGFMYRISTDTGLLQYQHVREDDPRSGATVAVNYLNQLRMLEQSRPDAYESLLFDCIYVDEGQDFHPEEFQLLMKLLKPHPKTGEGSIVIFYDDAQNLYGRPRPTWSQIGIDITGRGRSRVMKECFRNTREVVEFAFNVLLGTKADTAVRVQTREFADVAYLKENGLVEEHTDRWKVNFTERSQNLLPEVRLFESRQQEMEWIASKIAWLINDRQVRSEDVLVLFEQANEFVGLEQMIISKVPSLAGFVRPFGREKKNVDKDSYILQPGKLTLSTTKGAKGYDAYVVFLIGADQFPNTREGRASFYVGATRGKLALYVSGRNSPGSLLNEAAGVHQMLFLPNY